MTIGAGSRVNSVASLAARTGAVRHWLGALDRGCTDLSFSIALNVPWNERGKYLLNNLQLGTSADFVSPVLECVFNRGPASRSSLSAARRRTSEITQRW